MSGDSDAPEIPWWKQGQALAREQRIRDAGRPACARPGDAILIVTEGTVTEPVYFSLIRKDLKLSTVTVAIHPGDHSDPRHVIRTAERLVKARARRARKGQLGMGEPPKFDHVWAVIDSDVAVRQDFWNDVVQLANARKVTLAHSSPCFEFWLLLHLVGATTRSDLTNGTVAKAAVRAELGQDYSTNEDTAKKVMPAFVPKWPEAVKAAVRVRNSHASAGTPAPANPSTEVDRLVCTMNDAAQPHHRRIPCAQS